MICELMCLNMAYFSELIIWKTTMKKQKHNKYDTILTLIIRIIYMP